MNQETPTHFNEIHWIESESLKKQSRSIKRNNEPNEATTEETDDDDDLVRFDLFADPDPIDTFVFGWQINFSTGDVIPMMELGKTGINDDANFDKSTDYEVIRITLCGYKKELGQTLHSTGLTLWRASELLCQFMLRELKKYIEHKHILELGSGLGLCGILASKLYAGSVILTDGDTDTMKYLRKNIEQNCSNYDHKTSHGIKNDEEETDGIASAEVDIRNNDNDGTIGCRQLIWGYEEQMKLFHEKKYDVIIGSDIIYVEEVLIPLWDTVQYLLEPYHGKFLLSYARRNVSIDLVFHTAKQYGFVWEEPTGSEGVYVFALAHDNR